MTAEQIRLYAVARCVAPVGDRIRTIAEPAANGILYTIILDRHGDRRFFAIHNFALAGVPDGYLAGELRRAFARPVALDQRA